MKQAIIICNSREVAVDVILEPLCEKRTLEPAESLNLVVKFMSEPTDVSETLEISFEDTSVTVYATNVVDVDWE